MLLAVLIVLAVRELFFTHFGWELRHHPRAAEAQVHAWVGDNYLLALGAFLLAYVALAVLLLPVWWLQILGGAGFGIVLGTAWSLTGAVVGSLISVLLARWLAADWFQGKVEAHRERLRRLDEKLGHNGLLVVMAVRLVPVVPYSVCNYLLGVTRVSLIDVALGTVLGSPPHVIVSVTAGANPHLLKDWRFWLAVGASAVLVSTPIILRYRKPEWFQKHGIE